jgi:hypothetical protein
MSLHRGLPAVVEVVGDQKRVDLLGERRVAQRERAQRRIAVNVGGVDESERHERIER